MGKLSDKLKVLVQNGELDISQKDRDVSSNFLLQVSAVLSAIGVCEDDCLLECPCQ